MAIKKNKISFDWWDAVVEIDTSDKTKAILKEQVLFWTGGQRAIDMNDGDIVKAYLGLLALELIRESMDYTCSGIVKAFADKEGWFPLNGEHGVKLISVDSWEFIDTDFVYEEI